CSSRGSGARSNTKASTSGPTRTCMNWNAVSRSGFPTTTIGSSTKAWDTKLRGNAIGAVATSLGAVSNGGSFKLPASFWEADVLTGKPALSAENPSRYLIFEGAGEGKGQLVLTFWKGSQK